jgi:hypothetical protein
MSGRHDGTTRRHVVKTNCGRHLKRRQGVVYKVPLGVRKLKCPFPLCKGELANGYVMRRHFRDLHPLDYVVVRKEGYYLRCPRCGMQVNPIHLTHINTEECRVGAARRHQRNMAVRSALALRQQFTVHGDVLECVEVFRYLGKPSGHRGMHCRGVVDATGSSVIWLAIPVD